MSKEVVAEQPKNQLSLVVVAQNIAQGLQAFEERKTDLISLKEQVEIYKIESLEDKAGIRQVSESRKKLKSARVEIEKEGKAMRDPLTAISKHISAKENELVAIIEPTEKLLASQEKWVKDEEARIELEQKQKEEGRIQARIDRLAAYGYAIDITFLKGIDDDQFEKVVDNARVEYEKEQAAKAEREAAEQRQREQDEKDRRELQTLREKQAEADRILKEREEEIARKEAELKRQEIERAEEQRREVETKERERVREIFANRLPQLKEWSSNGHYVYSKGRQWGIVTDIVDMPEDKFGELVKENNAYIRDRDAEIERIRRQEIEEAKAKAIEEQKEREAEAKRQEEERLAQASDKDKFAIIITQLEGINYPEMKSAKHKKLLMEVKELNAKVIAHIKSKV